MRWAPSTMPYLCQSPLRTSFEENGVTPRSLQKPGTQAPFWTSETQSHLKEMVSKGHSHSRCQDSKRMSLNFRN